MRITRRQLRRIIRESLQLEMFDTGSMGDEVGGTSLTQKKKQCELAGGKWISDSDDPSGKYGHCSKPIKEAINPREMEEPIGGWVGDALKNDPDFAHETYSDDIPQAVGDLVRTFDFVGDGWGGDYEKVVGDQVGQVIEIEDDIDGAQFTVLFPDGTKIMDHAMAFEMAR